MRRARRWSLVVAFATAAGCVGDSGGADDGGGPADPFADYTLDPTIFSTPPTAWERDTSAPDAPYSFAADQILLLLDEDEPATTAESVASTLGASVVGQLPIIGLYQLRLPQTGRAAVDVAVSAAEQEEGVTAAFYNLQGQVFGSCPASCDLRQRPESPDQCAYRESEYFETLTILDNLDVPLSKVRIGIVDTGIRSIPELAGYPLLNADSPGQPIPKVWIEADGVRVADDRHGTAVASIMVAKDGDGGINGLASRMLHDTVELVWGGSSGASQDPLVDAAGDTAAWMVSTIRVAQAGARVINMSYGWERGTPFIDSLRATFTRIFSVFPNTVFVIAAPSNERYALDGHNSAPAGIPLPHVITVGGTAMCMPEASFGASTTGPSIDIAASAYALSSNVGGGDPVVLQQGNSFAAPQVTSLVAVLRAISPTLSALLVKDSYVTKYTFPTAAEVSGRRLAFSAPVLQLLDDQGIKRDWVDPRYDGVADPVGIVINRLCGGFDYKIDGYGNYHVATTSDSVMGTIHATSFVLFVSPTSQPLVQTGCETCVLSLVEYPIVSEFAPDSVTFSWEENGGSNAMGAAVSGTMSFNRCRIDEREQLTGGPFIISLSAHFSGVMEVGSTEVETAAFEGAFNVPFAVALLGPAQVIDNLESECEGGLEHQD